jgi:hypothetical protein
MNIFRIMPFIDYKYLINLLDTPLENFKNELITHKVNEIDCNFIDYIINQSPNNITYLDEYYTHFNKIDINIIKNTKNSQDELLIDYYCNIDTQNMEQNTIRHISNFIKTNQITNSILNLFTNHLKTNATEQKVQDKNDILSLRCEIDKMRQDILKMDEDIKNMKRDLYKN